MYYKKPSHDAKYGMDFYNELPPIRKQHLQKMGVDT